MDVGKIWLKGITWMSKSVIVLSVSQVEGSNGSPVILSGPFGIRRTVNLNWATYSPEIEK